VNTIGAALTAAVEVATEGHARLQASPLLQSWPGIVHGGGMVALFDSVATRLGGAPAPRIIEARLTSSVPTGVVLSLEGRRDDDRAIRMTVMEGEQTLASGAVSALDRDDVGVDAIWSGGDDGWALPGTDHCLACGASNPLGLGARLHFDERGVWARVEPGTRWLDDNGAPHPALGPVLLDELAWWLGALAMREGGLTNRLHLTLTELRGVPETPLLAAGRFERVTPVDRRKSFWRTETALTSADGQILATASIVFRGGPEYSDRQMDHFRRRTPPDVFRRMFPNHAKPR
jgi:hypothetical protein